MRDAAILTLPDESEAKEGAKRGPLDRFGSGSERLACCVDEAKNAQRGVRERSKDLGQARSLRVVPILVPPAVFDEVKAVFDLPVAANVGLQLGCRDGGRVDAGHKIPALVGENLAFGRTHFTIDANGDCAMRKVQTLADILGVVQVDPQPAGFVMEPLFSAT